MNYISYELNFILNRNSKNMKKIKVYGTSWCHYCNAAREFFKEKRIPFEDINIEKNPEAAKEIIEKSGQMGVPVILIGEKVIVGFNREQIEDLLK